MPVIFFSIRPWRRMRPRRLSRSPCPIPSSRPRSRGAKVGAARRRQPGTERSNIAAGRGARTAARREWRQRRPKAEPSYHLVDPSPWPIVGAIAAASSPAAALYHARPAVFGHQFGLLSIGPALSGSCHHDHVVARRDQGSRAASPHAGRADRPRYGMALFIASEVMFFVAFFWAFFNSSLFPKEAIAVRRDRRFWPPKSITPSIRWHLRC